MVWQCLFLGTLRIKNGKKLFEWLSFCRVNLLCQYSVFFHVRFCITFFMTNTDTFSNTFLLLFLEMGEVDDSGLLSV